MDDFLEKLIYPFDNEYIIKNKKKIKKKLLERENIKYLDKKIAILGGSTTSDIKLILELFLLNQGIKPNFFESEYNKYWEDAMFDNPELLEFKPDIIFIHTSNRNITSFPKIGDTREDVENLLNSEYQKFYNMWEHLKEKYNCPIIQNNFEYPTYRLLGNADATSYNGKIWFINELNRMFSKYTEENENFFINDINYQSALYGLEKWQEEFYWYMYKYALNINAIPVLSYNVSNIIKAIYGKNKKGLVLDLDNTLWGGIIGDDGVENIVLNKETAEGEAYQEFHQYLKEIKSMGIILNINSKNDESNALLGLNSEDSILKPDDFIIIKANWNPKSKNIAEIANELNLGIDSLVFVDDNPAEREIINQEFPSVSTTNIISPDKYIQNIDRQGYFETTHISSDDIKKNEMYKQNVERNKLIASFSDYGDYLKSLKMVATIDNFTPMYMARISQLTNKSNQFNLTTKRYTQTEIEAVASDNVYIDLYGKLEDKFGDNGVVSVVIGKQDENKLHIDLWIMSCRVLKRDMEFAMMDKLISECNNRGITEVYGYYYKTSKNNMVKDFYEQMGFKKISENGEDTVWKFDIKKNYKNKNKYIRIEEN